MSQPRAVTKPGPGGALLVGYVGALCAGAFGVTLVAARSDLQPPGAPSWLAIPAFITLIAAAEYLFVRFRYRGEVNALNLVEAVLAPLLFGFPPAIVAGVVAAGMTISGIARRNPPVKAIFNIAQWTLASATGAILLSRATGGEGLTWATTGSIVGVLALIALINQTLFTLVLAIVNRERMGSLLSALAPVVVPGWLIAWAVNTMVGMLFVLSYAAAPAAVLLFPVPLIVLHLAYRGYAGARSDRVRLSGLHSAAQVLAEPFDPYQAIERFLREVARSFEARAAALTLQSDEGLLVHQVKGDRYDVAKVDPNAGHSLEQGLLDAGVPLRVTGSDDGELAHLLATAGWRDCLAAPLSDIGRVAGTLIVFDQAGLEGFEQGELAVMESLARETAATLAKGRLLDAILEEQRKLSDIVHNTSDGIVMIAPDGRTLSWNPAMERITGLSASDVLSRPNALAALQARSMNDEPVDLGSWTSGRMPPEEIRIAGPDGQPRHLSCSYSTALDPEGNAHALVMVARDISSEEEMEKLRQRFDRLARAESAQRAVVEQLQQALMPAQPYVAGVDLGICYVPSDPSSPTGGDLYDWQVMPGGDVHLAIIDVLGHGVAATKDALSVVHALRTLALQDCPLDQMVARADDLLATQNRDLVATVVVGRFDPRTRRMRIAGGGHPPPLLVSKTQGVRELIAPGGAIGWPAAGSIGSVEIELKPGECVVFYTDGIVESTKDIVEGTDMLIKHARDLSHLPAEVLARELVHRALADGDRRDDSLVMVLGYAPETKAVHATWRLPPDRLRMRQVRKDLAAWLHGRALAPDVIQDVELIAAELLSNAADACRSGIGLRAWVDRDSVVVEVEDDGLGHDSFDELGVNVPGLDAETGRGLFIVRSLASEFRVMSTIDGTIVRAVRSFAGEQNAAPGADAPSASIPDHH